jgi:hypothetical protein
VPWQSAGVTELLIVLVVGFLVIAASTVLGPRLGIASPLLLVAIGVGASFLPVFDTIDIDPEWILAGVLPPLLYSSAVSMPAMNFRREFGAVGGLSENELAVLQAQGDALLKARDHGTFDADTLAYALSIRDASQIALEMRGGSRG